MVDDRSPLVQRRRLRAELRTARQACGLTQERVASEMDWSLSKVIRFEAAATAISAADLTALLTLYQVTDAERIAMFLALARAARERSWWSGYRDVAPSSLIQLIEYESAATVIRQFETMFIPGILQTEDYARAVIQDYYDERPGSDRLRALVELRVRREDLLENENSPSFNFILDEAALHRLVGGSMVMRRQLRRLVEVAGKPNVAIAIIPFSAGLHPGLKGPFEVIEFADPADSEIVFLESSHGDIFSADIAATLPYREAFERLVAASLSSGDSLTRLSRIADEMS